MDNSLRALCDAIKKITLQLKPQTNQLSFVVMTGLNEQGKSSILKQSGFSEIPIMSEQHAKLYFNQHGILLELGENWISQSKSILHNTLKQLNKCNKYLKITGFILCIDVNELLTAEPSQFTEHKKNHLNLITRMGMNLGYPVELALLFSKMDSLAGFSEFYQTDHVADLVKPLGFSLDCVNEARVKKETFNKQFNKLVELLGQQVITKIHPARSTIKRTLIREFPLQLASLKPPIQSIISGISPHLFNLHSVYFTSAEQGGISTDRLNKKIQHEYALAVQDTFPQAVNYRAYFVEGALKTIQQHCLQTPQTNLPSQKKFISAAVGIAAICLVILSYTHMKTSHLLDETSKELLTYDALNNDEKKKSQALYHLTKAARTIDHLKTNALWLPKVHRLQTNLHHSSQNILHGEFIPHLTKELEDVVTNPSNTPLTRYKALKIYLMFSQPEHLNAAEVEAWFTQQWQTEDQNLLSKKLTLLTRTLSQPLQRAPIKPQVISDARNYLNALPSTYLYYSLAKEAFPAEKQKIAIEGFRLATNELPAYFSRAQFETTIQLIPEISKRLQAENWVLEHQSIEQLSEMLIEAYCFDYATWWQTFMKKSQPLHYQDYQQGQQLAQMMKKHNSFSRMLDFIQQETKPDITQSNSLFNQHIANKFTDLNLLSLTSASQLNQTIGELGQFISTLSVIKDDGKTAFTITKLRFTSQNPSDPISMLFNQSKQLPAPLNAWTKQVAGDAWVILIRESQQYINRKWQETVYIDFQNTIANRYPFDSSQKNEISLADFNHFFSTHGVLNVFSEEYIKPFLDLSSAEWKTKAVDDFVLPISTETLDQLIRANIITNMFFSEHNDESKIEFSLQKINLDPVVATLQVQIGDTELKDNQSSESLVRFIWPQPDARLALDSIEGNHYELAEQGTWAIFKLLEKVNVLIDDQDSSSLQILFEVNSNSGRYLLKTNNQINPFTPGILNGFTLNKDLA